MHTFLVINSLLLALSQNAVNLFEQLHYKYTKNSTTKLELDSFIIILLLVCLQLPMNIFN